MLDQITPVILTYNEEPNIARTLNKLRWAGEIVVVDSGSTDRTQEIARGVPQVRVIERPFDSHAQQWSFAVHETDIRTDWVLALDADYVLTDELMDEMRELPTNGPVSGYQVGFVYCVAGKRLRGTLYPPVTALYRRSAGRYVQDGHTQRVVVDGPVKALRGRVLHDDRKSLSHWLQAQDRYMRLEADIIAGTTWRALGTADRLRKLVLVAPPVVFVYTLLFKRCLLDGRAGLFYALQRLVAELFLSLRLLEKTIQTVTNEANAYSPKERSSEL